EGVRRLPFGRGLGRSVGRPLEADDEHGAGHGSRLQEAAARDARVLAPGGPHRAPPSAARWIARRILWYVPQRHTWDASAPSMSASVGFGLFAMSSAAVMIIPDWQ